jgi:hypothetical protein
MFHWRCSNQTVSVTGYQACWHGIKAGVSNCRNVGQIRLAKGLRTMGQRQSPLKFYSSGDENFLHRRYYINRHYITLCRSYGL